MHGDEEQGIEYWALVDPDLLLKHLTVAHTHIDRAPGSCINSLD